MSTSEATAMADETFPLEDLVHTLKRIQEWLNASADDMEKMQEFDEEAETMAQHLNYIRRFAEQRQAYAQLHVEHSTRTDQYREAIKACELLEDFLEDPQAASNLKEEREDAVLFLLEDFIDEYGPEFDEEKLKERM
jgi:uncharacterized coiled-coil DUF342 family protein